MGGDIFTWGNFITWVICSILIYISLNFRLYMIFHHPGRKLKAKARAQRMARIQKEETAPGAETPKPVWGRECLHAPCYAGGQDLREDGRR